MEPGIPECAKHKVPMLCYRSTPERRYYHCTQVDVDALGNQVRCPYTETRWRPRLMDAIERGKSYAARQYLDDELHEENE